MEKLKEGKSPKKYFEKTKVENNNFMEKPLEINDISLGGLEGIKLFYYYLI